MRKKIKKLFRLLMVAGLMGGMLITTYSEAAHGALALRANSGIIGLRAVNLKQTSSTYALGIDAENVRLAWELESDTRNVFQSAYRLIVRNELETVYDTDWVASSAQTGIRVKNLKPETVYYWTVSVKDQFGNESGFAPEVSFETAPTSVEGIWIGSGTLLRREFVLEQPLKNVARARSYIGAGSPIEIHVNGEKLGDLVLGPQKSISSNYNCYHTYDVLPLLLDGENALGIICSGVYSYAMPSGACGMIKIYYKDGSEQVIATDTSWKKSKSSMITKSDWYGGEDIDGNRMIGWDTVGFDDSAWTNAENVGSPVYGGKYCISENKGIVYSKPVLEGDYTIEAAIEISGSKPYASILFGKPNSYPHMWQFDAANGELRIHYASNWSSSYIQIVPCSGIKSEGMFEVKIDVKGTIVTTYIDGDLVNTATIAEGSNVGQVGFRAATGEAMNVDYLRVRSNNAIVFEDTFDTANAELWSFSPVGELIPSVMGTKIVEELKPARIYSVQDGSDGKPYKYVLDFGTNMAGYVRVCAKLNQYDTVKLAYSELINEDGTIFANTTCHYPTSTYTFTGGEDRFEPHFFYNGFRYVEVTSPVMLPTDAFTACVISNDVPRTGSFKSSSERLNSILDIYYRAQISNMVVSYTDCPQREKQAWAGDASVTKQAASILFGDYCTAEAFMQMMKCEIMEDGMPKIVLGASPDRVGWIRNIFDIPWASAYFVFPYQTYMQTGDPYYIEMMYDELLTVYDYYKSIAAPDGVIIKQVWGDWKGYDSHYKITDNNAIAAAYAYGSGMMLAEMAEIIGRDHSELDGELEVMYDALQARYNRGEYWSLDTQANNAVALEFDLIPPDQKDAVVERLIQNINEYGSLRTGVLGTYALYNVLSAENEHKVLLDATVTGEKCSFGYMLDNGATSMWEFWDKVGETFDSEAKNCTYDSQNHCMFGGSMATWLFEGIGGIRATDAGYHAITYRPGLESGLSSADCAVDTVIGTAASSWSYENGRLEWRVTVPVNCEGTVIIPLENVTSITESGTDVFQKDGDGLSYLGMQDGAYVYSVGSGTYYFSVTCE